MDRIVEMAQIHSVIPLLFTPVPESALYEEYRGYLLGYLKSDAQVKLMTYSTPG